MPRHEEAKKDVVSCEKLRRGAHNLRPVDIRMGQPGSGNVESFRKEGEPREVKHLSTWRKRKRSDFLSSGERSGKSLNLSVRDSLQALYTWCSGDYMLKCCSIWVKSKIYRIVEIAGKLYRRG